MEVVHAATRRAAAKRMDPIQAQKPSQPNLWSRRFKRIDVVALTHAHQNHIGGLTTIFDNFMVNTLWVGREVASPQQQQLRSQRLQSARRCFTICWETILILTERMATSCGR